MPSTGPVLHGAAVTLRPAGPGDVGRLAEILAHPEVAPWWGNWDPDRVRTDLLGDEETTVFAVEVAGEVVGLIQAGEETDPQYRHAGIDVALHPDWQGRGLGTDALRTLARHLVTDRGHHRLTIDPAAHNERAIRSYRRVGFKPVGVMRRYELGGDGTWHDGLLMDLLAEELRERAEPDAGGPSEAAGAGGAAGTDPALELADWRARVAAMYLAEPTAGEAGWLAFRHARERLFAEHPQSPLTPAQRAAGTGLPYFPYDPAFRVPARLLPAGAGGEPAGGLEGELEIDTGGPDGVMRCRRVGRLASAVGELTLFWLLGYGGGLFLPFRDATAGTRTYGGGRYLTDTVKGTHGRGLVLPDPSSPGADGGIVVDFNYAYNPSCAYNARWACPLAPPENRLDLPITAGELAYPDPA